VWALAADGGVLQWNGAAWTLSAQFNGGKALAAETSADVWAGGIYVNSTRRVPHQRPESSRRPRRGRARSPA